MAGGAQPLQPQLQALQESYDARGVYDYEVTFSGERDVERLYNTCPKHPHHRAFIPINHLDRAQLPDGYDTDEVVNVIHCLAALTTRIMVNKVSVDRPQTWPCSSVRYPCSEARGLDSLCRMGTGFIDSFQKMFTAVHGTCPCPECTASDSPRRDWWEIRINTATHLVFDKSEARGTVINCFPHPEDTNRVHTLHGVRVCETPRMVQSDWCILVCATHDVAFGALLEQMTSDLQHLKARWSRRTESFFRYHALIICHPHGIATKAVSIGRTHHITVPVSFSQPVDRPVPFSPGLKYHLPASASCPPTKEKENDMNLGHQHSPHCIAASSPNWDEAPVPPNATFTLPKDADFARKYSYDRANCFIFPAGTKFSLPDGQDWPLAAECEFSGWPLEEMVVSLCYSTPTCPGSSGASVFTLEPRRFLQCRGRARTIDNFIHCRSVSSDMGESSQGFLIIPQPNDFVVGYADLNSIRSKA